MEKEKVEKTNPIPNVFFLDLEKQIEKTAYYKWLQQGRPADSAEKDWMEAEEEVRDSLKI